MTFDAFPIEPIHEPRRRLLLGLGALLGGCATPYGIPGFDSGPARMATLDVQGRVEVVHEGRVSVGQDGMALYRGDEVRTFSGTYAQLRFPDGDRVWLDYDTRVRLGSVFTFFGRVFAAVSGVFEVDSEFVAASSEGTEFTVTVGRAGPGIYSVAVRTGSVLCRSPRGTWRPLRMPAGHRLSGRGDAQPAGETMDAREAQGEFGWVPAFPAEPGRVREPVIRRDTAPTQRTPRSTEPSAPSPPSAPPSTPTTPTKPGTTTVPRSRAPILQRQPQQSAPVIR
jgi:hypothetical protein